MNFIPITIIFVFQLFLRAEDGGTPKKFAETHVTISVNRNLIEPRFTENQFVTSIPVDTPSDTKIFQVTAEDFDPKVQLH